MWLKILLIFLIMWSAFGVSFAKSTVDYWREKKLPRPPVSRVLFFVAMTGPIVWFCFIIISIAEIVMPSRRTKDVD